MRLLKRLTHRRNTKDEEGTVRVRIALVHPQYNSSHIKGNITRSFTVKEAKVSTVADAFETVLEESDDEVT